MVCPLCRTRKAKRQCPGIGQEICAVCCGTKRLVEIACPPDCVYLTSAQRHPAAAVKRQQEQDLSVLVGALGRVSEGQLQTFFVIQTFITRHRPDGGVPLTDSDVAAATGALATSFETASRGVLFEPQATSPGAESLRRALKTFLAEAAGGRGSRFESEIAAVLRGIERGASHQAPGIGSGPVDYLALVARILHEPLPAAADAGSRIILP